MELSHFVEKITGATTNWGSPTPPPLLQGEYIYIYTYMIWICLTHNIAYIYIYIHVIYMYICTYIYIFTYYIHIYIYIYVWEDYIAKNMQTCKYLYGSSRSYRSYRFRFGSIACTYVFLITIVNCTPYTLYTHMWLEVCLYVGVSVYISIYWQLQILLNWNWSDIFCHFGILLQAQARAIYFRFATTRGQLKWREV